MPDQPESRTDDSQEPPSRDRRLAAILDQFIDEHLSGHGSDIDTFCERQPVDLRSTIRERCHEYLRCVEVLSKLADDEGQPPLKELGDFRIIREIGSGGMGIVYLAWQKSLHRTVALKVLHPGLSLSSRHLERFRREGIAAGKLQHPFIVRILAADEADGLSYLAMDYVEGRSLADELSELRTNRVEPDGKKRVLLGSNEFGYARQVARFIKGAAEALQYAHDAGVIHRDIKPQNLLMREGERPCIVDFGLAKEIDKESLSREGEVAGTPYYMSPEQALAKRVPIDHRTDVFSLGAVMYEMLTLTRPFNGDSIDRVFYEISFKDPERVRKANPAVHRDLETICHRALEKNPERRFQSMADMAAELNRFLNNESLLIRPTLPVVRWTRAVLRSRALTTAAVFLLLFVVSLPIIYFNVRAAVRRQHQPKITLTGVPDGYQVFTRAIDLGTSELAKTEEFLGTTPIESRVVEPGFRRIIVVDPESGAFAELTHHFPDTGYLLEARVWIRPTEEVEANMVRFAAGPFQFGSELESRPWLGLREVAGEAFFIDRYEVSIGDYKRYVAETRAPPPQIWQAMRDSDDQDERELYRKLVDSSKWDDQPITGVRFLEATAYAEWAGKRLPTLFEWERAARGTKGRLYPWVQPGGPTPERARLGPARFARKPGASGYLLFALENLAPVRALEAGGTPEGVLNLLGNAQEWTDTPVPLELLGWDFPLPPTFPPLYFFAKGGSFVHPPSIGSNPFDLRAYDSCGLTRRNPELGFRCAKSVRR